MITLKNLYLNIMTFFIIFPSLFSNESEYSDKLVNYYQISISANFSNLFNQTTNEILRKENLLTYNSRYMDYILKVQFKPFYSEENYNSFFNQSFLSTTLDVFNFNFNDNSIAMLKFDFGVEYFIEKYLGLAIQTGGNYNWSFKKISDIQRNVYNYNNNGFSVSLGYKIIFLADFFISSVNNRLIPVIEIESNIYSPNLFSFSKNSASKLVSDDVVPVNNIDYDFPYGYSISLNVGVRF